MNHPRSAFGAPPQGGAASGPAKPDPRRLLGVRPLVAILAVAALLLAQALGLAHRVAHAPHAHADGATASAFDVHHDEGSAECRLVDQAAFGDAVTTPVVVAGLPPASPESALGALAVAVARLHAQPYCARGPPPFLA